MNNEVEPLYRSYAKQMLDVDELPEELEFNLAYAESLIKKVKPCGFLSSTQTIATIIMITNLKYRIEPQNFDYIKKWDEIEED